MVEDRQKDDKTVQGNSHSNYTASCTEPDDPLPEFGTPRAVHSTHQRVLNARLACRHDRTSTPSQGLLHASRVIIMN
jgi:hypothetical protein